MLHQILSPDDLEAHTPICAEEALEEYYVSKFCTQSIDEYRQMFNKMNKTQRRFYSVEKYVIEEILFDLIHPNNGLDIDQALTIESARLSELKNSKTASEGIKDYAQFGLTAIAHFRRRLCI